MTARAGERIWLRALAVALLAAVLAIAGATAGSTRADAAAPALDGTAFGVELCPQFVCGAATFIGYFGGEVDGRRGGGWWMIAVRHDALPDAGATSAVTGGRWALSSRGARVAGTVLGGSIHNHGDDTFALVVALGSESAQPGTVLTFRGTLDHRRLPPTARGVIAPG